APMLRPVRSLLGGFSRLAHGRLALLGAELREEGARVRATLVGAFGAIMLGALGLAFAGGALVLALDESHRAAAAAGLAIVFLAGGGYAAWWVQRIMAAKPGVFSASLAELERDREALVAESRSARGSLAEGGEELLRLASIGVMAYTIARRLRR
ncbi:MAG TPA: phage holin family protein, partial [Burkholderiales bacterium]|nr:phage holin family protein [Burkholderiales bacterium]